MNTPCQIAQAILKGNTELNGSDAQMRNAHRLHTQHLGDDVRWTAWEHAEVEETTTRYHRVVTKQQIANQQNVTVSNVVASVSQYGSFVQFSDFLVTTALDNYLAETAELLGEQAGSTIDLVVRNIISSGTNVKREVRLWLN